MNNTLLFGYDKQQIKDEQTFSIYELPLANTLLLSSMGCGELHFMTENIKYQKNANMIILDTGDQLFSETYDTLIEKGYSVLHIDYDNGISKTEKIINPFAYSASYMDITDFAETICNYNGIQDPCLKETEKQMIVDYLMSYREEHNLSKFTISTMYRDAVSSFSGKYIGENVSIAEESAVRDIVFALEPYKDMGYDRPLLDMSSLFSKEKVALFLEVGMEHRVPNMIYAIMLNQIIKQTMTIKTQSDFIFFFPEAWGNIVNKIPWFSRMLVAERKCNIALVLGAQSVNQLSMLVLQNMQYFVANGPTNDRTTAEYLSGLCGVENVRTFKCERIGKFPIPLLRRGLKERRNVESYEFHRMPKDECMVLNVRGHIRLKKLPVSFNCNYA